MPDATLSNVVTRPLVTPYATGTYNGAESIFASGDTVNLNLSKQVDLMSAAQSGVPQYSLLSNEALSLVFTKSVAGQLTAQFSLNVTAAVNITQPDGTTNPFNSNLSIQGTATFTPEGKVCHIDYKGGWCGADLGCDGSQGLPHGTISLDSAATSYAFSDPGAYGYAALVIANNAVTTSSTGAQAPDPALAAAGAHALILGASALEHFFSSSSEDPVQGYGHADADVLRAMGGAALTMIAAPDDQDAAVAAVVAATVAGARLALIDGLAAYDVAAHAPPVSVGPLSLGAPGDILLG
ncbi:hypothetical protein [Phenylobacterium soli]|uniref:Uncharacterized protein n=1 Tax=Phenylobacterium soli TaxID=2170551 RepID=A0A328ABV6_9CAUL|nr:hypothetical protein [Phenylobacterium soli]RAK51696.1 hypothetical protein DJ017_17845 [Phenylobacterium soli]